MTPEHIQSAGAAYVALYTQLWNEDEAMMARRQALLDRTLVRGCRSVALDGTTVRFGTTCPHLGGPLEEARVEDGSVVCPWHGYRFDLRTGRSCDGRDLALEPPPA
jgi:Rieske Fe-S protein